MQLDLGNMIRQLRHRDGRTQEMLAEALGVTSQAVSRWESGGSYPDMNLIPSIANYFGVTIDELFGYTNERDSRIQSLVSKIQQRKRQINGADTNMDQVIALYAYLRLRWEGACAGLRESHLGNGSCQCCTGDPRSVSGKAEYDSGTKGTGHSGRDRSIRQYLPRR